MEGVFLLGAESVGGTSTVVMGPIVEYSCDAGVGIAIVGVGAEVGTDLGASTGSDRDVDVAEPLQPTSAKISKSDTIRSGARFSPVNSSLLICEE